MRLVTVIVAVLVLVVPLAGAEEPETAWTLLFYFAVDNNLEEHGLRELEILESALPEKGVEALVLIDRAKERVRSHGDWTETRLYRVRRGKRDDKIDSELLESWGETSTGDPETLRRFIAKGLGAYPSRRAALFLYGHGLGWISSCPDDDAPGTQESKDEFSLQEFRGALEDGLRDAGRARFDLLGLCECLMGQLEVLNACRDASAYIVASEALLPVEGLPMAEHLADLAEGRDDPRELARRMVDAFLPHLARAGRAPEGALSAVDTGKIEAVVEALDRLCERLIPLVGKHGPAMSRSLFFAETFAGRLDYRRGTRADSSRDLLDVLDRIRAGIPGYPAEAEHQALEAAVKEAVFANAVGTLRHRSRGLSIYAPVSSACRRESYGSAADTQGWAWNRFLEALHSYQDEHARRPRLVSPRLVDQAGREATQIRPLSGATASVDLEGRNLLWVTMEHALRRDDRSWAILWKTFHLPAPVAVEQGSVAKHRSEEHIPAYPDGRQTIRQEVGGILFRVESGEKLLLATVEQSDPSDLRHAEVHGFLTTPDGAIKDARVTLRFDVDTWRVASVIERRKTGSSSSGTNRRRIRVPADSEVKLLLEIEQPNGRIGEAVSGTVTWGREGPRLVMTAMPDGPAALFVRAESLDGSASYAMVPYQVVHDPRLWRDTRGNAAVTASRLEGRWRVEAGAVDRTTRVTTWRDAGAAFVFARAESDAPLSFLLQQGEETIEGRARLDDRGVPLLSLDVRDGKRWVRRNLFVALYEPVEGIPVVRLRSLAGGGTHPLRLVPPDRRPPSTTAAAGPTIDPGQLVGSWRDRDGLLYELTAREYTVRNAGQVVERGTWRVDEDRLIATDAAGGSDMYRIVSASKARLVLDGADGRSILTRAR